MCQNKRYRSEPRECVFQTCIVNSNLVFPKIVESTTNTERKINLNSRFSLVNICKRKISSTTCVDETLDIFSPFVKMKVGISNKCN